MSDLQERARAFDCPSCSAQASQPCQNWQGKPRPAHNGRVYLVFGGSDTAEAVAYRAERRPKPPDVEWRPGEPPNLDWRLHEDKAEIAAWLGGQRIANALNRLPGATTLSDVKTFLEQGHHFSEIHLEGRWNPTLNLGQSSETLLRSQLGLPPVVERCPHCGQKLRA